MGLDQLINLATKIVMEVDDRQLVKLIWRFFASSLHLTLYTSKKQSVIMIKLWKSIFNKLEHKKDN